jgi:predicted metalloprotease with PDZ domain
VKRALISFSLLIFSTCEAQGQTRSEPQPFPLPPPIEAPRDIAYPGTMTLHVDATDLAHRVFAIHQTIPVTQSGPMTLLYPKWIPGAHSASGPLHNFAGLHIAANGQTLKWTRDPVEVYAYHIEVPTGTSELLIDADHLTPTEGAQGGIAMTNEMLRLNWYSVALYPAGYFSRRVKVDASVILPAGWQFGTALEVNATSGDTTAFKTVSFETLVDSPLFAGKYFRKIDLDPNGRSRVTLNVMADEPELLDAKPAVIDLHRELIRQADKLYGARHYDHYDFLLSLSEKLAGAGIEHQRSSNNGTTPKYFTGWDTGFISRDLLPHEYSHSWNGKYRRPADLWTPNFNVPMRTSLLWVYEGQTQYWGNVLAARAGFLTKEQALDSWANTAATYDSHVGRAWRNLQDTTADPLIANRRAIPWRTFQRSEDYYSEGQLVWLEVDTLIRERSKNKRSLDDFARAFFGVNDGDWGQLTYTFDDVVDALNKIEPFDWAAFLKTRLEENAEHAPLDGLRRGGYKLVYVDTQSEYSKANESRRKSFDVTYSLGMVVDSKGGIDSVLWNGPAFKADLVPGIDIVAINGLVFDGDRLKNAIKASRDGAPIDLLVKQGETYRTVRIDYRGGTRYPKLERIKDTPALFDDILTKKK